MSDLEIRQAVVEHVPPRVYAPDGEHWTPSPTPHGAVLSLSTETGRLRAALECLELRGTSLFVRGRGRYGSLSEQDAAHLRRLGVAVKEKKAASKGWKRGPVSVALKSGRQTVPGWTKGFLGIVNDHPDEQVRGGLIHLPTGLTMLRRYVSFHERWTAPQLKAVGDRFLAEMTELAGHNDGPVRGELLARYHAIIESELAKRNTYGDS